MRFDIVTIFPDIFTGFTSESLLAKAQKKKLITIATHYLRKWTNDRHQTVDGKPYGGGPGLVFKVEPIFKAISDIQKKTKKKPVRPGKSKVVLFSPRGKKFDQAVAKKWAKLDQIIMICGRYEGVDERVADHIADEVVSIGDYVLNGGEVAAMVVMEAVARLLPGFMQKEESSVKDDHPSYTKPEVFEPKNGVVWRVPKILLSGNHAKVEEWRRRNTE